MTQENREVTQKRMEDGRLKAWFIQCGIPPVYHQVKLPGTLAKVTKDFISTDVKHFNSGLFLVGNTSEESYKVGAYLAKKALQANIPAQMAGMRSLYNVYKGSFRDADSKVLVRHLFNQTDILVLTNLTIESAALWLRDPSALEWFRFSVRQRTIAQRKTAFCLPKDFAKQEILSLLGASNETFVTESKIIKVWTYGPNRQPANHKNSNK